jgi:hypothetical protein
MQHLSYMCKGKYCRHTVIVNTLIWEAWKIENVMTRPNYTLLFTELDRPAQCTVLLNVYIVVLLIT